MNHQRTEFVAVFRTGQIVHLDWACKALDEAQIPYQRREETSGGLRLAMPVVPSVGPGTWWTILVPASSVARARETLANLPFEQTTMPDVWSFQPKPAVKLAWKVCATIFVGAVVFGSIIELIRHLS